MKEKYYFMKADIVVKRENNKFFNFVNLKFSIFLFLFILGGCFFYFSLVKAQVENNILEKKLLGYILLQTEARGEAWYVDPVTEKRLFLSRPDDAFNIMKNLGLGISHEQLQQYFDSNFPNRLLGRILLDVEKNGEAYYINPRNKQAYYLGRPHDAFSLMSELSLGISNKDLEKILISNDNFKNNDTGSRNKGGEKNSEEVDLVLKSGVSLKAEKLSLVDGFSTISQIVGEVLVPEGEEVIDKGILWSYNLDNLNLDKANRVSAGAGSGNFTSDIIGLQPNLNYFFTPYVIIKGGEISFDKAYGGGFSSFKTAPLPISASASYVNLIYTAFPNGSILGTANQTIIAGANGISVLAVPSDHYHFVNWSDGSTNNPRVDINVNSDLNISAVFVLDSHTVSFNGNGADSGSNQGQELVEYNSQLSVLPNNPVRSGYVFLEWNTEIDGSGQTINTSSVITEDLIIYAQWELDETCVDGIKNQDETAIDCGGSICDVCLTYPYGLRSDWRWQPLSVSGPEIISSALLAKEDSASLTLNPSSSQNLLIEFPANDNGGIFTYQISDDDSFWSLSASYSLDSIDGEDGNWVNIPVSGAGDQYGPTNRLRKVYVPAGATWFKFSFANTDSSSHDLSLVGLREFGSGVDDDYWVFVGASIVGMSVDYETMHSELSSSYSYDPLIFNHGNPSKTIQWLDSNIDDILLSHPKAKFVAVHMGGNNVSNKRPFSTMTQEEKDDFENSYRSVISKIQSTGKVAIPGRLTFRNYEHDPLGQPGVYGGGMPENGSLPFNTNIIDPIISELTPDFYDNSADWGAVDLYTTMLNNQEYLNPDGVHPTVDGRTIFDRLWQNTAFKFVYEGALPTALIPDSFNTPVEDAEDLVEAAEASRQTVDINLAQDKLDELDDWPEFSAEQTSLQNRLNQVVPTTAMRYWVDFGSDSYLSTPGWNNLTTLVSGSSIDLITDSGATSTLSLSVTYDFPFVVSNTGLSFDDLPISASRDAFNVRGYISNDSKLTLSGLSSLKRYSLDFYSSANNSSGYITDFTINGETKSIISSGNSSSTAQFAEVIPDGSGEILIEINSDTNYGYLNAMLIQEIEVGPSCSDGIQNQDETGVDCGGIICDACPPEPTCSDGIQNQDETGVDCGGTICDACQSKTYLIDFGTDSYLQTIGNWNNVNDHQTANLSSIIDSSGDSSNINVAIISRFTSLSASGVNTETGAYPQNVVIDYFYTSSSSDPSVIQFSGLDINKTYDFTFFASRDTSSERNTDYTINGQTVTLACGGNTNDVVTVSGLSPEVGGILTVTVEAGLDSSYAYLGAIEITEN